MSRILLAGLQISARSACTAHLSHARVPCTIHRYTRTKQSASSETLISKLGRCAGNISSRKIRGRAWSAWLMKSPPRSSQAKKKHFLVRRVLRLKIRTNCSCGHACTNTNNADVDVALKVAILSAASTSLIWAHTHRSMTYYTYTTGQCRINAHVI